MFRGGNKRCRKMLDLSREVWDSNEDTIIPKVQDSSEDTSIPKYRRVYQKLKVCDKNPTPTSSSGSKVTILKNIQILPAPGTSKEVNSFHETPKRRKIVAENSVYDIYDSPTTGTTLHVMQNAEFLTTPTSKRLLAGTSKTSTPSSVQNISLSRCSSVSDLSCAKYLACPLSDDQVSELLIEKANTVREGAQLNTADPVVKLIANTEQIKTTLSKGSPKNDDLGAKIVQNEPEASNQAQVLSTADSDSDENYVPSDSSDSNSTSSSDFDYSSNESEHDINPNNIDAPCSIGDNDDWIDINELIPGFPEFSGQCKIDVPESTNTPYDYYKLFVCDDIIQKMVTETNKYAEEYIRNKTNKKPKSRLHSWIPTDMEEMKRFLGVLMAMGLTKVPVINDYWSKKPLYRNTYIVSIMRRDRFLLLLKFWHFSDQKSTEKLSKVKDIYIMLLERFQKVLKPGKFLIIDESMIPWRGRLNFRQYIKNKSHKYGVKLYKLCTPEGYTFSLLIYAGKGENGREMDHGRKTVMKLIKDLVNEGRVVITDNFYNSVGLAEELLENKTFICGTLRSNRKGLPKSVISTKLKKGEVIGKMNRRGVRVIKWFDKRPVHMISTCRNHNTSLKNTGKRVRGSGEEISKPECVLTYNNNKKGIDYSDQMASYYSPLRRGLKWFRKVMMELLFGTALVNSWLVYNWHRENRMPKKDYYEAVMEALTNKPMGETVTGKF